LKTTIQHREGYAIVRIEGKIVRENQGELRERLEELIPLGTKGIALDLNKTDYMDSAGLGCCASVRKLICDRGAGSLAVFGASANIERMWKLIRLDLIIPLFQEEAEALAWLASGASGSS
jgi:anti-anti-sigma factor